jgi:uncharacterized repeat protein (TIGR01451 family)
MDRIRRVVRIAAMGVGVALCALAGIGSPSAFAQTANLGLTVTDAPDPVTVGENVTFTLTLTNTGPNAASNVVLTDPIPAGTTFFSLAAPAGWAVSTPAVGGTGNVTATRANLPAGGPQVFTLVVNVSAGGGSIVNVASVASSTPDPAPGNDGATTTNAVTGSADFAVTRTGPALGLAGAPVIDSIAVTNIGAVDAQDVTVSVPVPVGTVAFGFAQQSGPAFSLAFDGVRTFSATTATLPAGSAAAFLVGYTINAGIPDGTILTTAAGVTSSTTDTNPANNSVAWHVGVPRLATGVGPGGGPHVQGFTLAGAATATSFFAYAPAFTGGVFVDVGAVDGSGLANLVTGAGPGGGAHVRVLRTDNSDTGISFLAYPGFTGGVRVAAGDVDGDGRDEIITAPGPGGGPHVKVWKVLGTTASPVAEFLAYPAGFTGGVFVAAGDIDGDGRAEIVTGADAGGGPHVRIWKVAGSAATELASFFAYPAGFTGGVRVAVADLTGDGRGDIVTAAGPGGGPHVKAFDGVTLAQTRSFFAYDPGFTGGVFVAASRISGVGSVIVTGAGAGGGPHVQVFDVSSVSVSTIASFLVADPAFTGGVPVAIGH